MIMLGSAGDDAFGKLQAPPDPHRPVTQSPYIIVEDVDAHYARAKAAGAEIVIDIRDEDYGGRGYSARDPEGHLWNSEATTRGAVCDPARSATFGQCGVRTSTRCTRSARRARRSSKARWAAPGWSERENQEPDQGVELSAASFYDFGHTRCVDRLTKGGRNAKRDK